MELQFEKKMVSCLRRDLWQTQDREFTQELRLGDDMPDIGTVLAARGQYVMRGKEWQSDSIGVSGGVMVWVLYAPADGDRPRCVEVWIPVQARWPLSGSQREGTIRTSWLLRAVDARCISARKLMVRAELSLLAEALEPWETELYTPDRMEEDLQLLRRTYPACLPKEAGEKLFNVEEELAVSPEPRAILALEVEPRLNEQKVLGGKAVFRGDLLVHMLYEGTDGLLHTANLETPFSQFSDLDRDYDKEATVCVMMALSSLEPELVEGRLALKCGLVAQYVVWDCVMLELVEDAYSLSRVVVPQTGALELPMALDRCRNTVRCETTLIADGAKVVDTWTGPAQPRIRRAGGLTELELWGNAGVLYQDKEGQIRGGNGQWSAVWELPAGADAAVLAQVLECSRPEASAGADGINVKMDVTAQVLTTGREGLPMVKALEMGESRPVDEGRPSLILRRAGEGSLWELAKNSGSTVDAIRQANGLEEEPIDDRILLIPVC